MTSNGTNTTEDTEMGECDGDKVVTMLDVLQEEQDFEEDANAVLGASDDKNCSYNKGYIKRQAIYACMTCCYDAKIDPLKRAGVCLACSLICHENHELIELYTKRNFRCDCGNAKFNSHPCQFNSNKTDLNEDNKYNQNYSGLYCTCHRPYPDPESSAEDEMIQCIICEDWLHASHLDAVVPDEPYSEMICKDCMEKNNFLHDYSSLAITAENVNVDIASTSDAVINDVSDAVNGITESLETLEKTKELDVEMKVETESNLSDQACTKVAPQIEDKTESISNSENDTINDHTNELKNEDVSNDTNFNKVTKIEEKEHFGRETLEAKAKEQLTEDNIKNTLSEDTALIAEKDKSDCEMNLPDINKELLSVDEETIKDSGNHVDKEESKEPIAQDTNITTTDKANSINDKPLTENNETKNVTDIDQNLLKLEEDLLNEPSNTAVPTDQQQEEVETEITKSSTVYEKETVIGTDNEPVTDTENTTVVEHFMDVKEETEMDVVEKKEESDSSNTELQHTVSDNPATTSEANDELESINTLETDTLEDTQTKDETHTKDDSTKNEKDSTKDEKPNSITTDHPNKESNIGNVNETVTHSNNENKRKLSVEEDNDDGAKRVKPSEIKNCIRPRGIIRHLKGATFWPSNFRQKLCTCNECLSMYKDLAVLFLIDPEDTVAAYEALGKERSNGNSQYEKGLQALSSLDRIQQINAVTEYNKLREKLSDFLKSFMLKKEIVKEEDIKAFFAGMKPKREPDGVYFCR